MTILERHRQQAFRAKAEAKMLKFRIHFEWPDGTEDSFDVSGETIEEIRDKANETLAAKLPNNKALDAWSEELRT